MEFDQLLDKIKELQEKNTEEAYTEIIDLIDKYLAKMPKESLVSGVKAIKDKLTLTGVFGISDDIKERVKNQEKAAILEAIKAHAKVNILELQYEKLSPNDKKERIHLQGKLINAYKDVEKKELDQKQKYAARHKRIELLEAQQMAMKDYRQTADNVSLPEKVSLKVKEVGNIIKAFLAKKDILVKIKNILKEIGLGTITSAALIGAIGIAVQLTTGLPVAGVGFASLLPIIGYTALTSGMRNFSTQTPFEQYEYFQSDEFKEYMNQFKEENKEILQEFENLLAEKPNCVTNEDKIQINEALIEKLDEIMKAIDIKPVRDTYGLQALAFMRENKEYCQNIIDEYLDEKNDDEEKYKKYNQKLGKLNVQIFARENSLKDALKDAAKGVVKNTAIMALAKVIVTAVAPASSLAIHGINSFILPVAMALTNGLIEIPTYSGKLRYKETSENKKIDTKEEKKLRELFSSFRLQMA